MSDTWVFNAAINICSCFEIFSLLPNCKSQGHEIDSSTTINCHERKKNQWNTSVEKYTVEHRNLKTFDFCPSSRHCPANQTSKIRTLKSTSIGYFDILGSYKKYIKWSSQAERVRILDIYSPNLRLEMGDENVPISALSEIRTFGFRRSSVLEPFISSRWHCLIIAKPEN